MLTLTKSIINESKNQNRNSCKSSLLFSISTWFGFSFRYTSFELEGGWSQPQSSIEKPWSKRWTEVDSYRRKRRNSATSIQSWQKTNECCPCHAWSIIWNPRSSMIFSLFFDPQKARGIVFWTTILTKHSTWATSVLVKSGTTKWKTYFVGSAHVFSKPWLWLNFRCGVRSPVRNNQRALGYFDWDVGFRELSVWLVEKFLTGGDMSVPLERTETLAHQDYRTVVVTELGMLHLSCHFVSR